MFPFLFSIVVFSMIKVIFIKKPLFETLDILAIQRWKIKHFWWQFSLEYQGFLLKVDISILNLCKNLCIYAKNVDFLFRNDY